MKRASIILSLILSSVMAVGCNLILPLSESGATLGLSATGRELVSALVVGVDTNRGLGFSHQSACTAGGGIDIASEASWQDIEATLSAQLTGCSDGDVVVVQNEMELRCTRAEFDDSKCRTICLSSEQCGSSSWPAKPARLTRGDNSIEGRQLEFDLCTSRLSGSCGARVVLNPERKPTAEAAAGGSPQAVSTPPPAEKPAP